MRQYVIDAFTDHVFAGNPAAVCLMDRWLGEAKMMAITIENNLSETAFAVREGEKYHLRWFTPGGEIDLCGHATLGTACAIMTFVEPERTQITFSTLSGDLTVVRRGDRYEMDFPAYALRPVPVTEEMVAAMNGARPRARRAAPARDRAGHGRGLRLAQLRAQVQRRRGPGLRFRPLPHRAVLGAGARQGHARGISGQSPRRHALLHAGGRPHPHEWKRRGLLRGGHPHRLSGKTASNRTRPGCTDAQPGLVLGGYA